MTWIPVDKELPRSHLVVLGAILESGNRQAVHLVYWSGNEWHDEPCGAYVSRYGHLVTHWMPLPDPPAIDDA
jgi:hypothetical protein